MLYPNLETSIRFWMCNHFSIGYRGFAKKTPGGGLFFQLFFTEPSRKKNPPPWAFAEFLNIIQVTRHTSVRKTATRLDPWEIMWSPFLCSLAMKGFGTERARLGTFKKISKILSVFTQKKKTSAKKQKFIVWKIRKRSTCCDFQRRILTSNFSKFVSL